MFYFSDKVKKMSAKLVTLVLVLCGILQTGAAIEGKSYENALLVSSTNIFGNKIHFSILPGTLYDMIGEMNASAFYLTRMDTLVLSMEVDYTRQRVYLYDHYTAEIYVISNFDWKTNFANINRNVFHNGVSRDHTRLGLDWVSDNVYWTDPLYRWIAVQSGDSYDTFKILIHDNLERPTALAVDPVNRYLFWSDIGSKTVKIERSTLSGADRKTIISTGLVYPSSIDVDLQGNKIVWVDADRDTLEIANFDGSERHAIRRLSHSNFYDIAVFKDLVCVTDNSTFFIINKNTGVLFSGFQNPYGEIYTATAIYSKEVQPSQNDVCVGSGCSEICVGDRSGPLCMCREGFKLNADNKTCSEDIGMFHRAVVWTNKTNVCLTDIRVLTTRENSSECVYTQGTNITHLDIDTAERKIIFTDGSDIFVLTLGTNTAKTRLISTSSTVTGLAVDWRDDNVYWSEGGNPGRIKLVFQATGNDYTLIDTDLVEPRCLHLQPLDNYMFWISGLKGSNQVERSNLDGANRRNIISAAALANPISLTSDSQTNRLYFIDGGFVKTCEPDGKDLKALSVTLFGPHMVFIYKNYLVLADSGFPGKLKTMDKTGTSFKFQHSDLDVDRIIDMKVLDASLQLQQHGACDVYNGGCEHICIPIGQNRVCQCEYGFQLDSDRQACSSEVLPDRFLLVTDWTHNRIYQVSLEDGEVRAVDTDTFGSPIGVAYNYVTHDVVWSTETLIHRLNFKTGEYEMLLNTESFSTYADRFAIDYTSGNLFYTAVGLLSEQGSVAVLSSTGRHKILIEDGSNPRAIALDPEDGLMFWTDHGDVPFVKSANMDGTSIRTIVSSGIVWPNGLAIDTKENTLYITDGFINSILKCTYTGICVTYYRDAEAHLMDIKLLGDYLYYTAWNRVYITKLHKTDTTIIFRVAERAELGRLDSLALYNSSLTHEPVSSVCSPNNGLGTCSTFCLPKSSGYTCACEDGVALLSDGKTCTNAVTSKSNPKKVTEGIPVAAIGGGAGGAAVLVITIVIVIIFLRRSGCKSEVPASNPSGYGGFFDMSSIYRGGGGSEVPIVQARPTSTYHTIDDDLINLDEQNPVSGVYQTVITVSAQTAMQDTREFLAKPNDYLALLNTSKPPSCNASNNYLTPLHMEDSRFHDQVYQDESADSASTQKAASGNPNSMSVI